MGISSTYINLITPRELPLGHVRFEKLYLLAGTSATSRQLDSPASITAFKVSQENFEVCIGRTMYVPPALTRSAMKELWMIVALMVSTRTQSCGLGGSSTTPFDSFSLLDPFNLGSVFSMSVSILVICALSAWSKLLSANLHNRL